MREKLLADAANAFEKQNFSVFVCEGTRACFDVIARRDEELFLAKVLSNIDSFTPEQASDLGKLAQLFNGKAILIGETTKEERLDDGVLYERHSLPTISVNTLSLLLNGEYPEARKFHVLSIPLDANALTQARKAKNLTLEKLAELADTSKGTIYRYEHNLIGASEESAETLERLLKTKLRAPINPFAKHDKAKAENTILSSLGFRSVKAKSAPFNLAAEAKGTLFAGEDADKRTMKKRADLYSKISGLLDAAPCFLLFKSEKNTIQGIPIVRKSELKELGKAKELLNLLKERSE